MMEVAEQIIYDSGSDIIREYESLDDEERELVIRSINDPEMYSLLVNIDFAEDPISPREFFSSPYYIGSHNVWDDNEKTGLFPLWNRELCYVLDPNNGIIEWVLSGCLGAGKTQAALFACMYKLYWLTC